MKVVIVGGGTAGWLTAAMLAKYNTIYKKDGSGYKYDVTVIESADIPVIGAGEGSTGIFADLIHHKLQEIGINEKDFLYETGATLKLGINFKDWNGVGTNYLSPIEPTKTHNGNVDLELNAFKAFDEYHNSNLTGYLLSKGSSTYRRSIKDLIPYHSYHFDAHKVGQYIRKLSEKAGVVRIEDEVVSLNRDENGNLKSVNLKSGKIIEGDCWFDCSGFTRVLTNEMKSGWVSYKDNLPLNSAMPYIHKYELNENVRPETLAWAQPNGWMWQIPTQQRYGCGYVYCDYFTNQDKALEELQKTTGRVIEPLRNFKFEVGRIEKFWNKNVITIGLASGFLEPLQATSIHSTILQLEVFITSYLHPTGIKTNEASIKYYNKYVGNMFDDYRDLIQTHYLTKRDDSEFWKFCKNEMKLTEQNEYLLSICKHRTPSALDFDMYNGASGWAVWGWTIMGLDLVTKETAYETLKKHSLLLQAKNSIEYIKKNNQMQSMGLLSNSDFLMLLKHKKI